MRQLRCECGGTITEPMPRECPHCGRRIVAVRRRTGVPPLLVVLLLFGLLVGFVVWLLR